MAAHDDAVQSKLACVVMLRGSDEATTVSGDGFKYYMLSLNANSEANSIGFYFDKNSNGGTQLRNGAHKAYLFLNLNKVASFRDLYASRRWASDGEDGSHRKEYLC